MILFIIESINRMSSSEEDHYYNQYPLTFNMNQPSQHFPTTHIQQDINTQINESSNYRQTQLPFFEKRSFLDKNILILDFDEATKELEEEAKQKNYQKLKQKLKKKVTKIQKTSKATDDEQISIKEVSMIRHKEEGFEKQEEKIISLSEQLNQVIERYEQEEKQEGQQIKEFHMNLETQQETCSRNLETIIGRCFASYGSLKNPTKIKYEINSSSLILKKNILITFDNIQKIKVCTQINRQIYLKIACKNKIGVHVMEQNEQKLNVFYLFETYEAIYTIFSSIVFRKVLIESSRKKNHHQKFEHNSDYFCGRSSLNVTSFYIGRSYAVLNCEGFQKKQKNIGLIGENICVQGMIYKKSKHLKKWSQRFIQIKQHQLNSYHSESVLLFDENSLKRNKKGFSGLKPTFSTNNFDELWTRFDLLQKNGQVLLIIKTHHFQVQKNKTQFAIPLSNFADIFSDNNWLYSFFYLLKNI